MKQRIFIIFSLILLSLTSPSRAQLAFSDSLRISLLTCSPGPDAYERFGHTGLRIEDLKTGADITFHYGVFSFNTPHFIYRFVKGETDYKLGAVYTSDFIDEYRQRGLGMTEARLRLNRKQQQEVARRLVDNYRPENRTYRYSYFFDNCATRPYRLIEAATEGHIDHDSLWCHAISLREMVHQKTGLGTWLQAGIALAVARRADQPTTYTEQMFLPDYLERAYRHAHIYGYPFVTEWHPVLEMTDTVSQRMDDHGPRWCQPDVVAGALLVIAVALTAYYTWRQNRRQRTRRVPASHRGTTTDASTSTPADATRPTWLQLSPLADLTAPGPYRAPWAEKAFDTLWLLLTGLAGCIVWFLNFCSEHPAVSGNLNCWWLLPTNVIFAVLIWLKLPQKVIRIYFFINFAALIAYFMLDFQLMQYCDPSFLPLLGMILVRDYALMTREMD